MAKKSLADLQAQIEKLQAQAQLLREQEKAGVVARIREAISAYGLSETDLFGTASIKRAATRRGKAAATRSAAYADGAGNVWGGRGPRPRWLREALQQGRTLEEFATNGHQAAPQRASVNAQNPEADLGNGTTTPRRGAGKSVANARRGAGKATTGKVPVKYRDAAGNSWSGRGSQPKWLKEALAAGGALESFHVGA